MANAKRFFTNLCNNIKYPPPWLAPPVVLLFLLVSLSGKITLVTFYFVVLFVAVVYFPLLKALSFGPLRFEVKLSPEEFEKKVEIEYKDQLAR